MKASKRKFGPSFELFRKDPEGATAKRIAELKLRGEYINIPLIARALGQRTPAERKKNKNA